MNKAITRPRGVNIVVGILSRIIGLRVANIVVRESNAGKNAKKIVKRSGVRLIRNILKIVMRGQNNGDKSILIIRGNGGPGDGVRYKTR